jgi:5-(hydroxymethyl)furfural/furfural oxidase
VLAGRLSEHSQKRILLIESGPDARPGRESADILSLYPVSAFNSRLFWSGLSAEAGAATDDGRLRLVTPYLQARGVGGGSNVNGMFADRGLPSDYDEWRRLGAAGWGWEEVLPFFKKLEHDLDCHGPLHGQDGPIPIRRIRPKQWAPFAQALASALERRGATALEDSNADFRDGIAPTPMNCLETQRVSASMAYLGKEVRRRPNLEVLSDTTVDRLLTSGEHVCGVEARTIRGQVNFLAPEVIVAGGAIHSPALLLRSGIGPAGHLRSAGVRLLRDLQGVGRNLHNHPAVLLVTHLRAVGVQHAHQRPWQQNLLRYSSKVPGCAEHDMLLLPFGKLGWHSLGRQMGMIAVIVNKAYSTGLVELASHDPALAPIARFNLLDDRRDFERMAQGVRMTLELLLEKEVLNVRNEVFVPDSALGARLAKPSAWNALQARLVSLGLRSGPLRRAALRRTALDVPAMLKDEGSIRDYVRKHAQAIYHACGTCKMGALQDPGAVVDASCRVIGIHGLRVVDASVFPSVPAGAPHLAVLMVAEKMAERIKAEWRGEFYSESPRARW